MEKADEGVIPAPSSSFWSHGPFPPPGRYRRIDKTDAVHPDSSALTYLTSVIRGNCADPPQALRKLKANAGTQPEIASVNVRASRLIAAVCLHEAAVAAGIIEVGD